MTLHSTKIASQIARVIVEGRDQIFSDGNNLYLRVRASGAASWVIRKREGTRKVVITLGPWHNGTVKGKGLTLSEARDKARNIDPKAAAQRLTFGEYLRGWYQDEIKPKYKKPHHLEGYLTRLEKDERALWNRKLRDVEHFDVFRALKAYAKKRGPVAANRFASILRTAFNHAVNAGLFTVSPLGKITAEAIGDDSTPRERVLSDEEIRALWHEDASHSALLRFLLVTGQRIGETQKALREEMEGDVWHIPAENTKNGRKHWVPLPPLAKEIRDTPPKEDKPKGRPPRGRPPKTRLLVFGRCSETAVQAWMKRWCKRHNIEPAFTPHDLRRTFSTRLNGLGVAPHIVERMLNHTMQGVMQVYNRAEYEQERKDAAAKWADELLRLVS